MISKKNTILLLFIIVAIGVFLRFYKLGNNSFVADEFLDINAAYGYFKTGVWQAWDFNLGKPAERINVASDERAVIYRWQVAELFKFFSPTEAVARSISAFWGIITVVLMYWTGWYFTKRKTIGLLSAFLFAVSVAGLEFDRRLRMYAMFFAAYLIFSLMLYRFLEESYSGKIKIFKKISDKIGFNLTFALPMILAGLTSFLVHQLTANIVFVIFVYAIVQFVLEYKRKRILLNKYSLSVLLMIIAFLGALILVPETVKFYAGGLQFFNNHWIYLVKIFSDYSHSLIALIFLLLGIYYLYRREGKTKETLWLAMSFVVPLAMAVLLWSRNAGDQYIFFIRSFEIILISAGIYAVANFFKENLQKYGARAYLASIILSLIILPNYGYFFQENNTYRQTSESENPNYRKVFTYVKKYQKPGDVIITRKFRNYYLSGAQIPVYDFGGEMAKEKFSLGDLQNIIKDHPQGWFVMSDNDDAYISNEAINFMEKNITKVSNVAVRGKITVYRWGNM